MHTLIVYISKASEDVLSQRKQDDLTVLMTKQIVDTGLLHKSEAHRNHINENTGNQYISDTLI